MPFPLETSLENFLNRDQKDCVGTYCACYLPWVALLCGRGTARLANKGHVELGTFKAMANETVGILARLERER